jgi:hypothetical protein
LPITKVELTYLLRALEDFDEIALKSSSAIPTETNPADAPLLAAFNPRIASRGGRGLTDLI